MRSFRECSEISGLPKMTIYWTWKSAMCKLSQALTGETRHWDDPYFHQIICDALCQIPSEPHIYTKRQFKTPPGRRKNEEEHSKICPQ